MIPEFEYQRAVLQALNLNYSLKQQDIAIIPYTISQTRAFLENPESNIRWRRRIPVIYQCDHFSTVINYSPSPTVNSTKVQRITWNYGLHEFAINKKQPITFWVWISAMDIGDTQSTLYVEKQNLKCLYRSILKTQRKNKPKIIRPILQPKVLEEIYNNTIGFLLRARDASFTYKDYNIPFKRGVLLCGPAGCGKTMTCKWLNDLCHKHGLLTKIVGRTTYEKAKGRDSLKSIFSLPRPGIIFFDDMDVMVLDRRSGNDNVQIFLSELDGIQSVDGVVFVFTTNHVKELDEAFVRPGRIDLFMTFKIPSEKLRREFISKLFHAKIKEQVDVDNLVQRTSDYTFAELDEIRKLLCIELIENRPLSLESTFKTFEMHRKEFAQREKLGFNRISDDNEDYWETNSLIQSILLDDDDDDDD